MRIPGIIVYLPMRISLRGWRARGFEGWGRGPVRLGGPGGWARVEGWVGWGICYGRWGGVELITCMPCFETFNRRKDNSLKNEL